MSFTKRWSKLVEKGTRLVSGLRIKYLLCAIRFIVVAAGRRSMKTEIAKRKLAWRFIHSTEGQRFAWTAPTEGQAKAIAWQDLKNLIPKYLISSVNESELKITHINGSELFIAGMDKPQRIEGSPLDGIVLDEFPDMKVGVWEYNVRPALADREGWAIILGVPDFNKPNNRKFKELFEKGNNPEEHEWQSFTWRSREVLSDSEVKAMAGDMSLEAYEQEEGGLFTAAPGRAYPHFNATTHVHPVAFDPRKAILISCDFNYNHHLWGIYQTHAREELNIPDLNLQKLVFCAIKGGELYEQKSRVEDMLVRLKNELRPLIQQVKALNLPVEIQFFGDYAGEQKKAEATASAWMQIRKEFSGRDGQEMPKGIFRHRPQPAVSTRLEKTNGQIMNAVGEVGVIVDPSWKMLIRDGEEVSRKQLLNQDKSDELTHISDGLGYLILQYK